MPIRIPLPRGTVDITGQSFGRLKVLEFAGIAEGKAYWLCECDCKKRTTVRGTHLRSGKIVSCGHERADPETRRAARMKVKPARRKQIAQMGGDAKRGAAARSRN